MSAERIEVLTALRDRLAKATGPDRELDAAVGGVTAFRSGSRSWQRNAPLYTASLAVAKVLVTGDDWYWRVGHDGEGPDPSAFKAEFLAFPAKKIEATADTPELALCLARIEYELAAIAERDS